MNKVINLLLALLPGGVVAGCHAAVLALAGQGQVFGSEAFYWGLLNALAVARFLALFAGVLIVWGLLRTGKAPKPLMAVAMVSAPIAYFITAVDMALCCFGWQQAVSSAANPVVVAALASSVLMACLGEILWRARGARKGSYKGEVLTGALVGMAVICAAVTLFLVVVKGGVPFFSIWQSGYELLFN